MKTILLADDYENIREFCKRELEEEGYQVITAGNGQEAIDLVEQHSPDLVILDIHMPKKNGIAAAEHIKRSNPDIPVIFFSDHDKALVTRNRTPIVKVYVEKSEDLTELKRQITLVLGSPETSQTLGQSSPTVS